MMFTRSRQGSNGAKTRKRQVQRRPRIEGLETRSLLTTLTALDFGATVTARSAPVAIGNELYFTATEASHGNQVWKTDGTVAGTVQVSDGHDVRGVYGGIFPADLTAVGNTLYFSASDFVNGYQLWKSDGTPAGTAMLSDLNTGGGGIFPTDLTAVGDMLYFVGNDPAEGHQLFESDGTTAGTRMVADIPGAKGYPGCYPTDLTAAGGLLYFAATDATHGTQLWSANPATGAVTMLTSGNAAGGGTVPQYLIGAGNTLYFSGFDATNRAQLWASQGTADTTERLTSGNASSTGLNPQMLTAAGNTLYFSANDGPDGTQLWSIGGPTPGAAAMLTTANVSGGGVAPTNLAAVGNELFFAGDDGVHSTQLWSSDGTPGGTGMVADINGTATSNVSSPTNVNGTLFFTAYTSSAGYQVWQSDGTSGGTVQDTSLATGNTDVPSALVAMGNALYFTAPGAAMWQLQTNATQTTPTIAWANPAGITYGTALSSTQLDASANVPGTFSYSPAAGAVLGTGTHTLSVTFTPTDTTDYTAATATTTITVAKATPTVQVTGGGVYDGHPIPAVATVTGVVAGLDASSASSLEGISPVLTYDSGGTVIAAPTAAGTYPVVASFPGSADYAAASAQATFAITPAAPAITWHTPASILYGTALGPAQLDATADIPGTFAYSPDVGTVLGIGPQTLSVTFAPTDSVDYTTATATATIAIAPFAPTITWDAPASIVYGTALGPAQLDATANVPGTFAYSPAAGAIVGAGVQTLSVTFTPTDATDYAQVATTTTIAVSRATPTITWDAASPIVYGTALGPGQLDATADVPGTFAYSFDAGAIPGAGVHTISATFTPSDPDDYTAATATAMITVAKATPTVHVADGGGVYDGSPFAATATVSGVGGASGPGLEGVSPVLTYYAGSTPTGAALGGPPTEVGTYTVVADFPGSADYAGATSPPVTFGITAAPTAVTLETSAGSSVFGQAVTLTATVTAAGAGVPTGTATFLDGAATLGVAALDASGRAVLSVAGLGPGGHSIAAKYGGDADRAGGQSGVVSESVGPAGTRIVLVPHAVFKRRRVVTVSLTAEVEPLAPGGGVPTGMVTFLVKRKRLGAAALNGGEATLTFKPGKVFNKSITMTYGGADEFLSASLASPPLTAGSLIAMARGQSRWRASSRGGLR